MHVIGDIESLSWYKKNNDVGPTYLSLEIGFTSNKNLPVFFSNLSFGFSLHNGDQEIDSYIYEENQYISSDQSSIYSKVIPDLISDKSYELKVWAKNNGEYFDETINITTCLPPSPYPSWIWNKDINNWEPPIPMPDTPPLSGWIWDENSKSWLD